MNKYKGKINVMGYEIPLTIPTSFLEHNVVEEGNISGYTMTWGFLKTSGVGSVLRQVLNFLKKKGEISFDRLWIRTEVYSGGNSIRVYTTGTDEVSYVTMKNIVNLFQEGSFNGMIDLYELKNVRLRASFDIGIEFNDGSKYLEVNCGSKYNFIYNEPPFDVREKMLKVA